MFPVFSSPIFNHIGTFAYRAFHFYVSYNNFFIALPLIIIKILKGA